MANWIERKIQEIAIRYIARKIGLTKEQFKEIEDEVWGFIKLLVERFGSKEVGFAFRRVLAKASNDDNAERYTVASQVFTYLDYVGFSD